MENSSYKDLYTDIRKQSKIEFRRGMLAGHFLTRDLGRICSVWFIKHGFIPNQITLLMIIFGIVGSIFFAIPNIWCKIVGYLCWLMWFAMDCSDGQVARYTKNFSKYGTEMDYMAHLIDHPCMNIAIWATFIQMDLFNPILISFIFLLTISIELIMRNIISFDYFHKNTHLNKNDNVKISLFKYFWQQFCMYPTFIVCFSWVIILAYYFHLRFIILLYFIWVIAFFLNLLKAFISHIKTFYIGDSKQIRQRI